MKIALAIIAALLGVAASFFAYRFNREKEVQLTLETQRQASADEQDISVRSKLWWDIRNKQEELKTDAERLENDKLEMQIAEIKGRSTRVPRQHLLADEQILRNHREILDSLLSSPLIPLEPHEEEERILAHNRKFPKQQIAGISDILRFIDGTRSQLNGILEDESRQLQNGR